MKKDELVEIVSKTLWESEHDLSDGFEFYQGGYSGASKAVQEISEKIVNRILALLGVIREQS